MAKAAKEIDPEAFIASLFAPLPSDAEPVETKAFRKQVYDDAWAVWNRARLKADFADHVMMAWQLHTALFPEGQGDTWLAAIKCYREELGATMRISAPHLEALSWKRARRHHFGGCGAWEAAIAADEVRLATRRRTKAKAA